MEKLRRVLSGQDDEEQGLTAQVTSPASATMAGEPNRRGGVGPGCRGCLFPAASLWPFSGPSPSAPMFRGPCSEL